MSKIPIGASKTQEVANDLLSVNLNNICHELALLTNCELDAAAPISNETFSHTQMRCSADEDNNNNINAAAAVSLKQQYFDYYQQVGTNLLHTTLTQCGGGAGVMEGTYISARNSIPTMNAAPPIAYGVADFVNANNHVVAASQLNQYGNVTSQLGMTAGGGVPPSLSSSPKFEFHFLRNQSSVSKSNKPEHVPLLSTAPPIAERSGNWNYGNNNGRNFFGGGGGGGGNGTGAFRKHQKSFQKLHEKPHDSIDYDKVVVDLKSIGLSSTDHKERNPILRLFELFRKMHYYLNEVLPTTCAEDFTCLTPARAAMLCTMNVQYQVKQAARKCTIFLCDMQRILNANKLYDLELYLECERSLNMLRKLLSELEVFKRVELEHKRGKFVTADSCAQAERLELLMEQMIEQIRQSHLYVHLFNWAMEKKYNTELPLAYQQQQYLAQQQQQTQPQQPINFNEVTVYADELLLQTTTTMTTTVIEDSSTMAAANVNAADNIIKAFYNNSDMNCQFSTETEMERELLRYIG